MGCALIWPLWLRIPILFVYQDDSIRELTDMVHGNALFDTSESS